MREASIYMIFLFGFIALLFRGVEKLRWFGGKKDEEFPVKDGIYWLSVWFGLLFLYLIIPQIGFLIQASQTDPVMLRVLSNQIFGIALLFALIFIMFIKGFINPTLNFLIALTSNVVVTLIVLFSSTYELSYLITPVYGMIVGIIIHQILKKKYEKGNEVLWEIPKVWKIVNNRWFLLIFTIIYAVEMHLQIHQLSITTVWFYF